DPVGNSWTSTTTAGAPTVRRSHTAVWTTSKMVVWGGFDGSSLGTGGGTGGQYDPLVNAWTPTTVTGAPLVRFAHVAVWTGTTMIVWGGQAGPGGAPTNTGGRWKLLSLYLKN